MSDSETLGNEKNKYILKKGAPPLWPINGCSMKPEGDFFLAIIFVPTFYICLLEKRKVNAMAHN